MNELEDLFLNIYNPIPEYYLWWKQLPDYGDYSKQSMTEKHLDIVFYKNANIFQIKLIYDKEHTL